MFASGHRIHVTQSQSEALPMELVRGPLQHSCAEEKEAGNCGINRANEGAAAGSRGSAVATWSGRGRGRGKAGENA